MGEQSSCGGEKGDQPPGGLWRGAARPWAWRRYPTEGERDARLNRQTPVNAVRKDERRHEIRQKLPDGRELPAAQAARYTLSACRPAVTHAAPAHQKHINKCLGNTQNPPLSLLRKQQKMTVRTYNPHKLTRTKKKAQTISGDRQGRHTADAWRGKDSVGPPGRSRFGQEQQSQSWSSRPPLAPTAPSSRDRMQTLEGRQAPPWVPGADRGWSPEKGRRRPPSGRPR